MATTKIEYLDFTWNPLVMRCTPVSAGCANCWHIGMAKRLAQNPAIASHERRAYAGCGAIRKANAGDLLPVKSQRVGVQFMGDLFHQEIPFFVIDDVFDTMISRGQHQYFLLTKRPDVLYAWLDSTSNSIEMAQKINAVYGFSAENQESWNRRSYVMRQISERTGLKVWCSMEPLLGPIDMGDISWLSWCVPGGETGPRARPMHPDWARGLRDQCKAAGVPYFHKQNGEWDVVYDRDKDDPD